jgi:hypothetical protein
MARDRSKDELVNGFKQSLKVIQINLDAYNQGIPEGWIAIATQIYKLLCDKMGKNALALHVFPDLKLHPMRVKTDSSEKVWLSFPFRIQKTPSGPRYGDIFDETQDKIPLLDWLGQTIIVVRGVRFSILQFFRAVRDKEAAHFDPTVSSELDALYLTSWHNFVEAVEQTTQQSELVTIAVAEYILEQLNLKLKEGGL